jgi:tetratricopeptide (TPR) repeat protein
MAGRDHGSAVPRARGGCGKGGAGRQRTAPQRRWPSRSTERKRRRSPWWSARVWRAVFALSVIAFLLVCGLVRERSGSAGPGRALSAGFQWVTWGRFAPDIWIDLGVIAIALVSIRSIWLVFLAFSINSPIEVRPLDNATRDPQIDTHRLDVAFSDYLALSRMYKVPTVPGDQEPDRLIEVLSTPASKGWTGMLSAAVAYAFPRRAFLVTGSLLDRNNARGCGFSVQVRRFPGLAVHLDTQWSITFERALQRGAYAVAAHITQQTKACRRVPWSEWERRERPLPAALFRDYQRAKQMVRERRYDEALALYHSALRQDAGNIAIRYDVGQLYERLGLYPDALLAYMGLVDEIFPVSNWIRAPGRRNGTAFLRGQSRTDGSGRRVPNRVTAPKWWPRREDKDPFIIRYRYVITLGQGNLLARQLAIPQWPSRTQPNTPDSGQRAAYPEAHEREDREWRTTELAEIGRLVSNRLDVLYSEYCQGSLADLLQVRGDSHGEARIREISRYLLVCAEYEAGTLVHDIERIGFRSRGLRSRRRSILTSVAVRQAQLTIRYRLMGLDCQDGDGAGERWPLSLDRMQGDQRRIGYAADTSRNWLEHYNAACCYAITLVGEEECAQYADYAFASVAALDRVTRFGEKVEFVISKKYWLEAGDPDLSGLRSYECFRAFEARVYGRPLPATVDMAAYELFRFLRALLRGGTRNLESMWRTRGDSCAEVVTYAQFEEWWRQELRAWEMAIRLGRFHGQWQTRHAALEAIRNWIESFGPEALPIPFPSIAPTDYLSDIGDYQLFRQVIDKTREIFAFLGTRCGRLAPSAEIVPDSLLNNTRIWNAYAAECSRSGKKLPSGRIAAICVERAGLWAALRQWAQSPDDRGRQIFADTIDKLSTPPS